MKAGIQITIYGGRVTMEIDALRLTDLQPSQFYISETKLRQVQDWFRPDDLSGFEAIPVRLLDGTPVMTDGHTRAAAALLAGIERVPLVWDTDDLDWEMYRRCAAECRKRNVLTPKDLISRVIPESEYREKWNGWCDALHSEIIQARVVVTESEPAPRVMDALIRLSSDWEAEGSCRGYRKNEKADIEGSRIFLAMDGAEIIGYLFGRRSSAEKASSVMPDGTPYFEVEELYVKPGYRGAGIGRKLFSHAERAVSEDAEYMVLSTATKDWRAILRFYLEELGMEFWNARLFKKLR